MAELKTCLKNGLLGVCGWFIFITLMSILVGNLDGLLDEFTSLTRFIASFIGGILGGRVSKNLGGALLGGFLGGSMITIAEIFIPTLND